MNFGTRACLNTTYPEFKNQGVPGIPSQYPSFCLTRVYQISISKMAYQRRPKIIIYYAIHFHLLPSGFWTGHVCIVSIHLLNQLLLHWEHQIISPLDQLLYPIKLLIIGFQYRNFVLANEAFYNSLFYLAKYACIYVHCTYLIIGLQPH